MTRFLDVVKRVAVAAVAAEKPEQLVFGTILTVSPFKVKLATQQELKKEFFLALDPKPDWKPGDKLVLLREQGGQRFLITVTATATTDQFPLVADDIVTIVPTIEVAL